MKGLRPWKIRYVIASQLGDTNFWFKLSHLLSIPLSYPNEYKNIYKSNFCPKLQVFNICSVSLIFYLLLVGKNFRSVGNFLLIWKGSKYCIWLISIITENGSPLNFFCKWVLNLIIIVQLSGIKDYSWDSHHSPAFKTLKFLYKICYPAWVYAIRNDLRIYTLF